MKPAISAPIQAPHTLPLLINPPKYTFPCPMAQSRADISDFYSRYLRTPSL